MKTSVYDNKEHLEGYVGTGAQKEKDKSAVQKKYDKLNDTNEVTSYGHEISTTPHIANFEARDGYDNSGTQGKDSLSDDSYHSKDLKPTVKSGASGTGSSTEDFRTKKI